MTGRPRPRPPGRRGTVALQHLSRGADVQGARRAARRFRLYSSSPLAAPLLLLQPLLLVATNNVVVFEIFKIHHLKNLV